MSVASFLSAIPIPALMVGVDGRLRGANDPAIALNPQANLQRPLILVFRQPALAAAVDTCLRTRQAQKTTFLHSEGQHEHQFEVSCRYMDLADGDSGVLVCFQDVTHKETAGQIRRDFVANVSHELRTPLTALLGFIETLRGPARNDADARERFLNIMSSEAGRMNRLVGDLLSLSRVEDEARMRPATPVDVAKVLGSAVRNLREMATSSQISIAFEPVAHEILIPADADQLMQVFTNLIENAIKYGGEDCSVSISIAEIDRDPTLRQAAVRIDVADTGPGIDPVHIPRLTERFYRVDSHRSREMGGTGLGLAIVKHIINRHRGRMKIESSLGEGSIFSVLLPKG